MKYLVMECRGDYAVLLDEQAGFVKAVNSGYAVGDTVENPELIKHEKSRSAIIMKVTKFAAAAAACLAVVFGINYYNQYMTEYSYITISINPDIKMSLNRHGEVLSLAGLNEDGDVLIDGYDPDRKDKTTVSDELIERAVEMGFLTDGDTITFEVDTPDAALSDEYEAELQLNALECTKKMNKVEVIIRKPENASPSTDVQSFVTTTATDGAVQAQTSATETTTTVMTTVSSAESTASSETTVTTTVTRHHKFPSIWDNDFTDRPSFRDDDDDEDHDSGYKDIDTDIDVDNDGDDNDIHDIRDSDDSDTDTDADSRDHRDDNDDSEDSYNKDDYTSEETDSTEEITEDSDHSFKSRHDDDTDSEDTADTAEDVESVETDSASEDEILTETTET